MKSYTSGKLGFLGRIREFRALYRYKQGRADERVREVQEEMEAFARHLKHATGLEAQGLDVLDVGPGQGRGHMYALAVKNRVVGIDLDVAPEGFHVLAYWKQWRRNGFVRVAKTVGRKALGIDRQFRRALARGLQVPRLPKLDIREMDATRMTFAEDSFDLVFSRSVFEHITEPAAALAEVARVLRPGASAFVSVHLYTSDSGCHDARILSGDRSDIPFWSHLQPEFEDRVQPNSYLNGVRLDEWRDMAARVMPGSTVVCEPDRRPEVQQALDHARRTGALTDYQDEELMTVAAHILWRKPER